MDYGRFTIVFLRLKSVPAMTIQHCFHYFSFVQYFFYFFYIECSEGFYGVNCLQNCSRACRIPGNCDRITGYCHGGCQRGWTGVRCEEGKHYIITFLSYIMINMSGLGYILFAVVYKGYTNKCKGAIKTNCNLINVLSNVHAIPMNT